MIAFELYVAPLTASTDMFCEIRILSLTVSNAESKYHESLSLVDAVISVIMSFSIVTVTVTSPSYPYADAVYVPF